MYCGREAKDVVVSLKAIGASDAVCIARNKEFLDSEIAALLRAEVSVTAIISRWIKGVDDGVALLWGGVREGDGDPVVEVGICVDGLITEEAALVHFVAGHK